MKKLLVLSSFIVFGFVAVNAQNAKPIVSGNATSTEQPTTAKVASKEAEKKKCSDEEKKQCGSKSAKSCCAHKAEAKKEEAK